MVWRYYIMKILMLDASTYGEDVNIDKFYALGEVKSYSTSTREEALKRVAEHNPDVVIINKIAADKEFIDAAPALKMILLQDITILILCMQRKRI